MRKLFAAVLAVCLVFAFVMPAAAADVKFSGEYFVRGIAWDKYDVRKDSGASDAYYFSKFRLAANIAIEEGVGAYFRGDIFDNRIWGEDTGPADFQADYAWGWFNTSVGKFTIGQMAGGTYGTLFGDQWRRGDKFMWQMPIGNFTLAFVYEKDTEGDGIPSLAATATDEADADEDYYYLIGNYKWDGGEGGVLFEYIRDATRSNAANVKTNAYGINPYMKAKFGPVNVEAEVIKLFGDEQAFEAPATRPDVSLSGWSAYLQAKMDFGPAYAGAFVAYVSGDDPTTADENEQGWVGDDWDLGFILFNDEDYREGGNITAHGAGIDKNFGNVNGDGALGYGLIAGIAPTKALSINAALVTAKADENNMAYVDDDFGMEADLELNYKIFSSVTYSVRFGYLWTGDYWKGTSSANEVDDIWMAEHMIHWKF